MARITFISADKIETSVNASDGDNLMQVATKYGIGSIIGECGGYMMCATCHIYVDETYVNSLPICSDTEDEMLECTIAERRSNSRLARQIIVSPKIDGIIIQIPRAISDLFGSI